MLYKLKYQRVEYFSVDTNYSQPNIETLIKISKVLNVGVSELLRTDEVQIDA